MAWGFREEHYGRNVLVYPQRPKRLEEIAWASGSRFSRNQALVQLDGPRLSYADFLELAEKLALLLQRRGICPGDRVALALGNTIWFPISVLAVLQMGGTAVPLNLRLSTSEISSILIDAEPRFILFGKEAIHLMEAFRDYPCLKVEELDWKVPVRGSFEKPNCSEDDPAFLIYTSGTTGLPKGVVLTHFNVIHSLLHYRDLFETDSCDRTLIGVPLFHVTGLIGQLWHMILVGGTSVLLPRYHTETFLDLMEREEITFTFAVPTIYAFLLDRGLHLRSLPSWRLAAYGGAPMPLSVLDEMRQHFPALDLRNAYGATETASPATLMPRSFTSRKPLSVGKPVPKGEIRIDSLGDDGVGEICIKGPMVTPGYYKRPEENARVFTPDGYWRSGDLGYLDSEGFLFVVDRLKETINRAGEKVYSQEVENVLYQHPAVLEAAVVGVPDPLYGERVKAVIVPRPGHTLSAAEVQRFVAERLAHFKVPEEVEFRDSLPRNAGGKVLKNLLRGRS